MRQLLGTRQLIEKVRGPFSKVAQVFKRRILIVVVAMVLAILLGTRPLVDWTVGSMYKNVAEPHDKEMPVTVTSYPSGPDIVGIVGGRGEGLNCSLPPGIDFLFPAQHSASSATPQGTAKREAESTPVRQRFRQACVFHDLCYRHGLATYGY